MNDFFLVIFYNINAFKLDGSDKFYNRNCNHKATAEIPGSDYDMKNVDMNSFFLAANVNITFAARNNDFFPKITIKITYCN